MSDFDGMVWFYLASNHRLGHVFLCECAFFLFYFHFVIVHVERDQKRLSGRLLCRCITLICMVHCRGFSFQLHQEKECAWPLFA